MKKVLLAGTALMGVVALSAPAHAEMKLGLGGYFAGYGVFSDNDLNDKREIDLRRDTEVHVSGETTLDNGLTVGFHTEQALGGATLTDESYAYFSGSWGRVNLGSEDGAAYLLQVAAPSADSNIDGLRTYVQALQAETSMTHFLKVSDTGANTVRTNLDFATVDTGFGGGTRLDYDHTSDPSANATDRISYLTPKFNGFQGGISYAPEQGQNDVANALSAPTDDNNTAQLGSGATTTTVTGTTQYENIWEASARWDGEFQGFGLSAGVGYSFADIENGLSLTATAGDQGKFGVTDGTETWNAGLGVNWNGFSLGGNYLNSEVEVAAVSNVNAGTYTLHNGEVTRETWVAGLGWDNGPWHLGATWLNQETDLPSFRGVGAANAADIYFVGGTNEVEKVTLGGGYTFGPGMTFRGSVAFGEYDAAGVVGNGATGTAAADNNFTQVAIGTQIDF